MPAIEFTALSKKGTFWGVAGGSGSGKTTFAHTLAEALGPEGVVIISQDSYYIDRSKQFHGDGSLNFDHPDVIDWRLMAEQLSKLESGERVPIPIYDFATHSRLKTANWVEPQKHIIIDGILIYVPDFVRAMFDVKVFIDTPEPVRFQRRLQRDVTERGRTPEGVSEQYKTTVLPMHMQFVEPTKKYADHVVSGESDFKIAADSIVSRWL